MANVRSVVRQAAAFPARHFGTEDLHDARAQKLYVCIAKEGSSGLNREIAEKIGGKCPSAVAHQCRRATRNMDSDRRLQRASSRDKAAVLSRFKG